MAFTAQKMSTRRDFLAALTAFSFAPLHALAEEKVQRLAVLDWAWAETALAIGIDPVAVAEADLYQERVVAPALPRGTVDLGLRSWPNMELLKSLRPDFIFSQADYGVSTSRLETIAPTLALPLYTRERRPLHFAEAGVATIASTLDREAKGQAFLEAADALFADVRAGLQAYDSRPLLMIKFADDRLIDIYGPGSLFHDVLGRLGIQNAWDQAGSHWGFSTVGLDAIARYREARLVIIEPEPTASLLESGLWNAIPSVRAKRVITIPQTWVFGGLPSALRFAAILGKALQAS